MIVIGSGPAGRRAAIQAAKLGKDVLVVERGRRVGGVSVHTGTIPSKTLRETALNLSGWRERGFYGRSYRVKQDITAEDLRRRLHLTLSHEVEVLEHQFARNQVSTLRGTARFTDPHTIEVEGEEGETFSVSADSFLIAVGTIPFRPDYIPFDDGVSVFDSDEILELPDLPLDLGALPRITISACGTAFYAGLVAKYWFEQIARQPVEYLQLNDQTITLFRVQAEAQISGFRRLRQLQRARIELVHHLVVVEDARRVLQEHPARDGRLLRPGVDDPNDPPFMRPVGLDEVEALLASRALVVDACRRGLSAGVA